MSAFAANGIARTAQDLEETTGSGLEQALLAAGDVFSGIANLTPVGMTANVVQGFQASQEADESRSFLDSLINGSIISGARAYQSVEPVLGHYTWDSYGKTYDYLTDLPAFYAANAAVLWQGAADAVDGDFDAEQFSRNADIASNIFSDTYEEGGVDVGQAILTNFAAAGQIATAPMQRITAAITGKPLDSIQAEQGRVAREWSLGFMSPDFNLFSAEDRQVFDEGLSRVMSGTLSATWQVALDPLNVIPFGAVGKAVKGVRLLNKASKISADERLLARAADGEITKYSRDFEFFARNNAGTIQQHALLRSVAGPQRSQLAYLLGQVTDAKDVAKVFLAVERGSLRAQVELANKYSHLGVSLDGLNAGGYVNRLALKGEAPVGVIDNAEYLDAVAKHLDTVDSDPFVKTMTDLAYREVGGELVSSPQVLRTMRSGGLGLGALERATAIGRARLIQDGRDGFSFFTRLGEGNPLIQTFIRPAAMTARGLMINGKGFVDVEDTTGIAFDRFAGSISDIDYLTNNELSRSGLKQGLLDRFRLAANGEERRRVIEEAEAVGFRLLAEKQGMSKARGAEVWKGFRAAHAKYFAARKTRGFAVLSDGSIVRDPLLREATDGTVELMDWRLINQALREDAGGIKGVALRGIGKTGRGAYTTLSAINNFHIAAILFRPARIPRERLQGSLGVVGSGYWKEMWSDPDALRAPARIIANMVVRGDRTIDRVMTRFGMLDDPKLLSELAGETTGALRATNDTIDALRGRVLSLLKRRDLDDEDRAILNGLLDELDGELLFHGSADGLPARLDDSRWLATTDIASDAEAYVDAAFPRVSVSRQLGREVDPAELKTASSTNRWQRVIDDTRSRGVKRTAEIDAKRQEVQPLTATLDEQRLAIQEAETRWADAEALLSEADSALTAARQTGAAGRKALIAQRAQAQRALTAAKSEAGAARRAAEATEARIRKAEDYIAKREAAQQSDEAETLARINSTLGQEFGSLDEARAFVRSSTNATDTFRTSLIDELQSGNTVQRRLNDRWVTETEESLARRSPVLLARQDFRVIPAGKKPGLTRLRTYGSRIEVGSFDGLPAGLAEHMGWRSQADVAAFFADDAWRSDAGFMAWARANRVGKVAVPDATAPSGTTVHVLPDMTDYSDDAPLLRRVQEQEDMAPAVEPTNRTAITNATAAARETETATRETRKRVVKTDDATLLRDEIRGLIDQRARLRNEQTAFTRRTAAAKARREGKQKRMQTRGQGQIEVGGRVFDDAFAGAEGERWAALSSARETFDNLVQGANGAHAGLDDIIETTVLDPSDPQYFDGWADILNTHYRQADGTPDPVVRMLAEGADDNAIRAWLLRTPEGKAYRESVGVGKKYTSLDPKVDGWRRTSPYSSETSVGLENMSVEDYVETLRTSINGHLPTADLRARFLQGEEFSASGLEQQFGPFADMLAKIDGRISIPSERRGVTETLRRSARNVQRVINEMPQTAMENHPMFVAAYRDTLRERYEDAVATLGRDITDAEAKDLVQQARRTALQEVRKWTYTISKTTNFTEVMRLGIPFITAYTFTARTIARSLRDNPAETLWFAWNANRAIGQLPWVDADGNPTNFLNAEAAVLDVSPETAKVLGKIPFIGSALANAKSIRISKRSMDVFFGGEVAPGAGALITVPLGEYVRRNPEKAGNAIVDWALPLGAGYSAVDVAAPKVVANTYHKWQQEDSEQYAAKLVQVAVQEDARYRLGLRDTAPTPEEIRGLTNALFDLSSGINFFSPISFSVTQPAQEARRVYDQYVEYYGKEEADWRFLSEQPELSQMFASGTLNNYRVDPTQEAVANLRKYSDVVAAAASSGEAGREMLGWLVNGSGEGEFDPAANAYLRQTAPGLSGDEFVEALSPDEALQRAAARNGWIQWRQITNFLDAEAIKRGTSVEADPELAAAKKYAGFMLGQENPEWARVRRIVDGNKFNDQAEVLEAALTDPTWMADNADRPEIKALAQFIEMRAWVRESIFQRGREQGLSSLADNPDLKAAYLFAVQQLKQESPMFAEFYNQYFDEDTVI